MRSPILGARPNALRAILAGALLTAMVLAQACSSGEETTPTPAPALTPTATQGPSPTTTSTAVSTHTPGPTSPAEANVAIPDFSYAPQTLRVPVGTSVTWTNDHQGVAHTVSSSDDLFDTGTFASGATFSYTFDESGTFEYYCKIHPFMTATIVVE